MPELSLTRREGIARITIDRPERKHAWSATMWPEMARLMGKCAEDNSVRVVLVTSTGDRVFSAGADLEQFGGADTELVRASVEGVESVMASIESCPKPVIAVVSGAAVGAGTEVAAACDVRIASKGAWFSIPAATLGIVITRSDIARLVRGVGASLARDMLLTGRRLTAAESQQIGFVRSVHPSNELDAAALDLAAEIVALDGAALAAMKAHLNTLGNVAWNEESWASTLEAITSAATQKRITARLGNT